MPERLFHSNVPIAPGNQIYLERPRIDRLLEKAIQNPVVIVNAGAGYGKTHAVYSFVHDYDALTCWMQLSERDNNGKRFWENFITGVSVGNREAAARLVNVDFPETEREWDRYVAVPQEETRTDVKYIFVYDDFHLVHDKAVLRFLERSITASFPSITSIIISRTEPSINLTKLLSEGLVGRITEDDLRFSQEEMVEYFHIQNILPPPQTISSIYYDTEGWAFAIHLAGLSLKNAPGTPYVPQAMRVNIFRLIESELISSMSPGLRKFLIKLSLVEHLAPDLLREIASKAPAEGASGKGLREETRLLEEMERIVSFIRFDGYQNAYRIHHLLLEYLSGKQGELSEDEKREVYQKAAAWCAANNQKIDAINYYEKAGDYERLIGVVETMSAILPNRTARMLLEIMERAPSEMYDRIATAQVIRTGLYLTLEMFDKSREELAVVIARLEAAPPSPITYRTLTGCYNLLGFIGMNTSSFTRDYDYVHYFEKARHYYEFNKFEVGPPISIIALSSYLCRVNTEEAGEMEKYIGAISASVPFTSVTFGGCALGMDDLCRGELAFFRGDIAGAEQLVLRALESARQGKQYEIESRALFYLLRINLTRGNYEAIEGIERQLEAQLDEPDYPNRFTIHDICSGWYYVHTGQTGRLASWLKNDFEESDLNSIAFGLEVLVKAKYHFAERRYPAALAVLESRGRRSGFWDFVLGRIEQKTLEAVCWYQIRDKKAAFAALETAYSQAAPNALYMPFTELGKDMRALTDAALKDKATALPRDWLEAVRRNASGYAKKLFTVAEQHRPKEARKGNAGQEGLSRREIEILTNLSQGMTQEEIAGISSLSVNTVKSVIRSIYGKLGAVNKADAVRIAVSRGLV
ncbi:MAG: LuxR C-terminal-related transcriptional regulator [Spirochaetaceae bacterium]|jgi:LuxR family maltose regulon positive regulatory protein|nr:LuxR C-terminal-related transcriptional regulator [Spirochaetaceae bacterium]